MLSQTNSISLIHLYSKAKHNVHIILFESMTLLHCAVRKHDNLFNSEVRTLTLPSRNILDPCPPVENHGAVMIHMQKGQLIVLLPQNEEHLTIMTFTY